MGSLLGPVNLMVELKASVIPNLSDKVKRWKRFVGDTYCFARSEYIDNVLQAFNHFHKNIKFTIEIEKDNTIPFLDISIIRNQERLKRQCGRKRRSLTCI